MSVLIRSAVLILGALSALAQAADAAQPMAPLVDAETVAVAHVDLSRVSVDAIVELLAGMQPGEKAALAVKGQQAAERLQGFRRAGVKDVYLIVSLGTPGPLTGFFAEIPLGPQADEKAIRALIGPPAKAARRVGNFLMLPAGPTTVLPAQFQPVERPELTEALAVVSDAPVQAALIPPASARRVVEELLPELPAAVGGGPSTVLTRGVRWAALGIELPPRVGARLVVQSTDAQAAAALQPKWLAGMGFVRQAEPVRQSIPQIDQLASLLTPRVEGDRWLLTLDSSGRAVTELLGIANHALESARCKARRVQSASNIRQIIVAMCVYHDACKHLPAPASFGPDGKPLLSWRVHLLPYLGQQELYRQFHLDEAWDSAHNKTLIGKMPAILRSPVSKAGVGRTNYLVPVGHGALFASPKDQPEHRRVTDGLSNTILLVEVDDAHAVVWTQPDDLALDPQDPRKGIGSIFPEGFNVGMCDGAARFLPNTIESKALKAAFTRAGGEMSEVW